MILLDMCVVSNPRRQALHPWVIAWIDAQPEETPLRSTIIAPELRNGWQGYLHEDAALMRAGEPGDEPSQFTKKLGHHGNAN